MLGSDVMVRQLLDGFLEALRELPEVQAELSEIERPAGPDRGHDAQVDLRAGGKTASLLIQVKREVYPRDVRQVLWQLGESARRWLDAAEGRQAVFLPGRPVDFTRSQGIAEE